jgi:hypothetical protein
LSLVTLTVLTPLRRPVAGLGFVIVVEPALGCVGCFSRKDINQQKAGYEETINAGPCVLCRVPRGWSAGPKFIGLSRWFFD